MGTTWHVELPGGNGKSIMRIAPRTCGLKDKLDGFVTYADGDGEEAVLRVGGQDIWKQRTNVTMGDKVVMTAKRTDKLSVYVPGRKLEWMVDVAAGMDMALASVIVVVLAANMYGSTSHESSWLLKGLRVTLGSTRNATGGQIRGCSCNVLDGVIVAKNERVQYYGKSLRRHAIPTLNVTAHLSMTIEIHVARTRYGRSVANLSIHRERYHRLTLAADSA